MHGMRNEHFAIMRAVRVLKPEDNMHFLPEAYPKSGDEMRNIAGRMEEIYRVPLVDQHSNLFFHLIENNIPDMILHQLPDILFVYLPEERFDKCIHTKEGLEISAIFADLLKNDEICTKTAHRSKPYDLYDTHRAQASEKRKV